MVHNTFFYAPAVLFFRKHFKNKWYDSLLRLNEKKKKKKKKKTEKEETV